MRQVPRNKHISYSIIGDGKVANHFCRYFDLLNLPYTKWSRSRNLQKELKTTSSHVLLLISDEAIESFYKENKKFFQKKTVVHFSGCHSFPDMKVAHPLMSFGSKLYDLEVYKNIPFVLEKEEDFYKILPGLENPFYFISKEKKALYHSYCVMAGNFTSLLWSFVEEGFRKHLGMDSKVLEVYKKKVFENVIENSSASLTGPFLRGDKSTIEFNLKALEKDKLFSIYEAFLNSYQKKEGGL